MSATVTGDLTTLERWLADLYPVAFRTACLLLGNRAEAEEAVQEAFLRAWRFRGAMPSGEAVRPWIYRVVVNACYSEARREQRHRGRRADDSGISALAAAGDLPEEAAERSEAADAVLRALDSLPEALRATVVLRYFSELSEKEIAAAIGRRPGTVKSRLHEARRLLGSHPALRQFGANSERSPLGSPGVEAANDGTEPGAEQ